MKITGIRTTRLLNPHGPHFQDATIAEPLAGLAVVLVEVETDAGHTGVATGQSPMRPFIHQVLEGALIGADPFETEKIWNDMFWRVRGSGRKGVAFQAISAVDNAVWDIKAKALGLPLHRLLGSMHARVPVYGSGGWTNWSTGDLVRQQLAWVERGFKAVKVKVGRDFGRDEAADVRRVAAVRKAVGDDVTLYIDANNGYYAKQAIRLAEEYKRLGVAWFEEPVLADDIPGLARVAAQTTIPVATGEHEYTKFGFRDLMTAGAADIVQADIAQLGGVTEFMKVAHMSEAFNLPLAPHAWCLLHLHAAMAVPNLMVLEWLDLEEQGIACFFADAATPRDGYIEPDDRPGNGLVIDPHAVEKFRVD